MERTGIVQQCLDPRLDLIFRAKLESMLGRNPDISSSLISTRRGETLDIFSLELFICNVSVGEARLEHSSGADISIAAPAHQKVTGRRTILEDARNDAYDSERLLWSVDRVVESLPFGRGARKWA